MRAYYNEIDPYAAQWLRNLIGRGRIAPGDVDERNIADVRASDLRGYQQHHFFAGIGGWSYALRLAGWPDDRPVWTGSCPCQPFSAAGKGNGTNDERHLWPVWFNLIRECRPRILFGEQVAAAAVIGIAETQGASPPLRHQTSSAKPGLFADPPCEGEGGEEGLSVRSAILSEGDSGADRSWSLRSDGTTAELGGRKDMGQSLPGPDRAEGILSLFEHSDCLPRDQQCDGRLGRAALGRISLGDLGAAQGEIERIIAAIGREFDPTPEWPWLPIVQSDLERESYAFGSSVLPACSVGAPHIRQRLWFMADAALSGRGEKRQDGGRLTAGDRAQGIAPGFEPGSDTRELGDAARDGERQSRLCEASDGRPGALGGPSAWRDLEWLTCTDGKARPTQSGLFPLAHGIPRRVGRLRAYGNAIVPQVAAEFIIAVSGLRP